MGEDGVGFTRDNAAVFYGLWSWATIEKGGPLDLISASDRGMLRSRSTAGARLEQITVVLVFVVSRLDRAYARHRSADHELRADFA